MKVIANDYSSKEVIKIIREWTDLTQEKFGKSINRSKSSIQAFERGVRNYNFTTLLEIADKHKIKIIIEKD